jgi:hypothetical protein
MASNVINTVPYLRTSREFPEEIHQLTVEINKSYVDIANAVNQRTIGLYPTTRPAIGGENWFITSNRKQSNLRQVYQFSDTNLVIDHGINISSLTNFTRIWGTFFDGIYWETLPYVDVINVSNQINIKVSSTQIIVTKGAGAPPSCNNGLIVLEWISNT